MARLVFAPSAITDTHDVLTTLIDKAGQSVAVAYWDRFQATFVRRSEAPIEYDGAYRCRATVRDHLSGKCGCSRGNARSSR
jgi:plasmid stabilization system protein ParE